MTATGLIEILARSEPQLAPSGSGKVTSLAEKIIAASIVDLNHIRDYERGLRIIEVEDIDLQLELRRKIAQLYEEWVGSARDLYQHIRALPVSSLKIAGTRELSDEIGRITALLTITPEQLVRAAQQARAGEVIPAKELRDELNARVCR